MLLNTWLSAAKRLFSTSVPTAGNGRRSMKHRHQTGQAELLESKSLLTALVINDANVGDFLALDGGLDINNATLAGHDSLVIEQVTLTSTGDAISINLSGIDLERIAIETVTINSFDGQAIDINLTNVTNNRTISIEDIQVNDADGGSGISVDLVSTDSDAITIEDSIVPSVSIVATNGSVVGNGLVTENEVVAPANIEAVTLTVDGATVENFNIVNNRQLEAFNRDAVQINLTDSPLDGLNIANNEIGNEPGADVLFRAVGDTFIQPFELTNNGIDGERLETFELDLRPLGLVFDDGVNGQPFTISPGSDVAAGEATAVLSDNNQVLTVTFTDFLPDETLLFVIDVDIAPAIPGGAPIDTPIFGNDLIGAGVQFNFDAGNNGSGPETVAGVLIGDASIFNASEFARGADAASDVHGINLNLDNSPLTNAQIVENTITGVAGNGLLFNATTESDVSGVVLGNTITSSGQDGIRFNLEDSNFVGAVNENSISANSGHGINFQPSVSQSGVVEEVFDGDPVVVTSTNHGLQTGDVVILQGLTNANPAVNHPGNGTHTVRVLSSNTFELVGVNGLAAGVSYRAGGTWYVPDFVGGEAQGLVSIDVKATELEGQVTAIQNPVGGGDVQLTSRAHGLSTGDQIRLAGATGTALAGDFTVTVISDDVFALDGANAVGAYDTSDGLATWQGNIITNALVAANGEVTLTSEDHGLNTGEQVRVSGVGGVLAANGTFTVTRLSADTFRLQNSSASISDIFQNGTGSFTPLAEETFTGDSLTQQIANNSITNNGQAGIFVNLVTGTTFEGDLLSNSIVSNVATGIHIESRSFGVGETLPLAPGDLLTVPGPQDIGFDVNIGSDVNDPSGAPLDGNFIDRNGQAGIAIEALDLATGSFEIQGNLITRNIDDNDDATGFAGDGIFVALESESGAVDSSSLLVESIIQNNTIGVDNQGNEGNGLSFTLTDRTRIQDLEVLNNFFGNNQLDGFNFVRTENGSLNSVVFEGNDATNNGGDGFDLFAENSVDDRLDFVVRRNNINNNDEYGVRINVQAAARIEVDFDDNDVLENGLNADGNGFHPNDASAGFAGNEGAAGGVGIFGFEEVEIVLNVSNSLINDNFGDGFSIDATDFRDTVRLNLNVTDTEFVGNTLAGFRGQGAAFASIDVSNSLFNDNGEDGLRIVATEDLTQDPRLNVRVAGGDISVSALGNQFNGNGASGALLGQAVSAVFGNGQTIAEFSNTFDNNGESGLLITQDVGPTLAALGRRRVIDTNGNFFRRNARAGVEIGRDVSQEGGNVEHGHEVASDVDVILNNAIISFNDGDGVEYLADSNLRIVAAPGSQQDIFANDVSSLEISNSRIESNGQRGVDILNRVSEDSRITLFNNEILANTLSGVYVLNTPTHFQQQAGPSDALFAATNEAASVDDSGGPARIAGSGFRTPNIELRVQNNSILDNGNQTSTSTITIPFSAGDNDDQGDQPQFNRLPDWTHAFSQSTGTLGGLVLRAGTADSFGPQNVGNTNAELGLSGIDAEVIGNTFNGNFGASFFTDSFVAVIPPQTQGFFDVSLTQNPPPIWTQGYRDPLARVDLVFRENSGNSLDVLNGFAFLDNDELYFKSRITGAITAPSTQTHANADPAGPFLRGRGEQGSLRFRNATRTIGATSFAGTGFDFGFDGLGATTLRVEPDFDIDQFGQTSTTQGFSTFLDVVDLPSSATDNQWDIGGTAFSLQRGSIFNVLANQAPIQADALDNNNNFVSATELGTVSGSLNVNSLTNDSSQPGILNIERKGDRDFYSFQTAEQFLGGDLVTIDLDVLDALGDDVQFTVYEVQENQDIEEVPVFAGFTGAPLFQTALAGGGASSLQFQAQPGTEYVIEVRATEASNLGGAQVFNYGTTRSYTLDVTAPVGAAPNQAAASDSSSSSTSSASSSGSIAAVNRSGEDPFVAAISDIGPGTINTSTDEIVVRFSEDVTGVDLSDFQLTRDGNVLDISGATLTSLSLEEFSISGLSSLTAEAGSYEFSVVFANSGIVDTDGIALQPGGDDSEAWTVDNSLNTFNDTVDNQAGDSLVADVNGNRSLRAAIIEANANPGVDIIELGAGTFTLALDGQFEDGGLSGDLDILETVTLRGAGAGQTIIDAAAIDRVFHVFPGAELILQNLTVQGGEAFDGGGVFVEGTAAANGITSLAGGTLTIQGVNIINNEAFNQGGGIYNLGTVTATQSSISRNTAGSRGGGVFNHGTLSLEDVTVSSNGAVSRGGGVFNEVLNSQVNPGISPIRAVGSIEARNVTFAFNSAGAEGGGIFQEVAASLRIGNTILDQNFAPTSPEFNRPINSDGNNFIGQLVVDPASVLLDETDIAADFTNGVVNAGLNALLPGANGTLAHTPAPGSAVIDAGNNSLFTNQPIGTVLTATDQTGSQRIVEANADGIFQIDIGASEFFLSQPVAILTASANPAGVNQTITFDASGSTHTLTPGTSLIASFEFDFDFDGVTFDVDATGQTANFAFGTLGDFDVALRVTDVNGNTDIEVLTVTIGAPPPPVITGPLSAGTSDRTPTITYNAGPGVFDIVITNLDTQQVVVSETGITDLSFTPSTPLDLGLYQVVVTATNSSGSTPSAPHQFRIVPIEIVDPSNFDVEFDITPEIIFTAIPDAFRYQVWITQLDPNDRTQALAVLVNTDQVNAQTALIPGTDLAQFETPIELEEGFYRVWVRAFDATGNAGEWSAGRQFTIERPSIIAPAFESRQTIDDTPTFRWTDVGANQYQIWIAQLNGVDINGVPLTRPGVVINTIVSGTEFTPPSNLGNGEFRVWVRAIDDDGEPGLWSAQYDFTKDLNLAPIPISPIGGATTTDRTPVFEWQAIEGAVRYELWVNDSSRQLVRIIHETDLPHIEGAETITFTNPDLVLRNATFAWWVRAFNEDGVATAWTDRQTFFVPAPVLTGPIGTITDTNFPTFSWTGVPEYVRYELWVNNETTGQSRVLFEPNLPGDVLEFTPELPLENGTFRVWVRGFDDVGNASQFSNPLIFTIDASIDNAPVALDTGDVNNVPFFIFQGLDSAQNYEILVRNLGDLNQPDVLNETTAGQNIGPNLFRHDATGSLPAGTYRWWIRGLNGDGTPGPWSQPLDFVIAAAEGTSPESDASTVETLLTSITSTLTPEWQDAFHSVTVHPAAIIEATLEPTDNLELQPQPEAAAESDEFDAAMADLAVYRWLDSAEEDAVSEEDQIFAEIVDAEAVVMEPVSSRSNRGAAALGALAAFTSRRSRRRREDD